jgi:DNA mismatch repair protein MLH1
VSSAPLKRALEGAYAGVLPKAAAPFVYLALALPPADVDVNVHPTKAEVRFLHEERICAEVVDKVVAALVRGAGTEERRFTTQTLLPGAAPAAPAKGKAKGKARAADGDDDADEDDEEEDADADADDAPAATPSASGEPRVYAARRGADRARAQR